MHLTNTSGNLFNSLNLLNIKDKPEIDEEEIQPKIDSPAPPEPESSDSSNESSEEQQESTQETTEQTGSDSSDSSASSSVSTTSGALTPEEAIKLYAERMTQTGWLSDIGSLLKNHDIITTLGDLTNALKQLEADSTKS